MFSNHMKSKIVSFAMDTKTSQMTSCIHVHSLPWEHCSRWILKGLMRWMPSKWGRLVIEGWGNMSQICRVRKKTSNNKQNIDRIVRNVSFKPKHQMMWVQWALDAISKRMLKSVWWCMHLKMESWSHSICFSMRHFYIKKRHPFATRGRSSQIFFNYHWIENML
jgi:hypothetical protein